MRLIRTIAVLALLVGLPLGSWLYLRSGADWRREGWREMEIKGAVNVSSLRLSGTSATMPADPDGLYLIISDIQQGQADTEIQGLADQFGYRNDLLLINLRPVSESSVKNWISADCEEMDCNALRMQLFGGSGDNIALIDSASNLRNTYHLPDEVRKLVKEGAILFPTEKREKLELKRGTIN